MSYDYFISHASEDKDLVARPLAHYLSTAKFNIWYDEFTLRLGDSLRGSIDRGLSESQHGVVILSTDFFSKQWPQRELGGLVALASDGRRILPVWHNVSAAEVASFSPTLADIKAVSTARGLQSVAEEIVAATWPERVEQLPTSNADRTDSETAARARSVLAQLLEGDSRPSDIFLFLSAYHALLAGMFSYDPVILPAHKLETEIIFDFAVLQPHGITGPMQLTFVVLGPTASGVNDAFVAKLWSSVGKKVRFRDRPYNDYLGHPYAGEYPSVLKVAQAARRLVEIHNVHGERPGTWTFGFLILAGRRDLAAVKERDQIRRGAPRLEIASYDRLLDTCDNMYGYG